MIPIILTGDLDGANARNWPGLVILDPDCPKPAAVLAQEWWESLFKLNPVNLIRTRTSDSARRKMEIMGHAIEVAAEVLIYGANENSALHREARAMRAGYDDIFENMSASAVVAAMTAERRDAHAWVKDRIKKLERYK
ncbi:hypothetical protein [Paracoccus sp. SY]|uniref:hypothetical protein n=1 Tax=Paracoccus sp. SY TaxID=1330255 RepID=UPI000CCFE058|nr:hypothetical protein [Paracoccus sp. SY]